MHTHNLVCTRIHTTLCVCTHIHLQPNSTCNMYSNLSRHTCITVYMHMYMYMYIHNTHAYIYMYMYYKHITDVSCYVHVPYSIMAKNS